MPLQPHAQKEVEEKIKELFDAFSAGYNFGKYNFVDEVAPWYQFKTFLELKHPAIAPYFDPDKVLK